MLVSTTEQQNSLLNHHVRWRDVTKLNKATEALVYGSDDKATYLKITLMKLVLFIDSIAYQDYLAQHASFVFRHGNRDRYTASWTTIEGELQCIDVALL